MVFWCVPSVSFGGHVALIMVGNQVFYWWAPGISFCGHGALLLATCHLNGHPLLLLVGTWHLGEHLASS